MALRTSLAILSSVATAALVSLLASVLAGGCHESAPKPELSQEELKAKQLEELAGRVQATPQPGPVPETPPPGAILINKDYGQGRHCRSMVEIKSACFMPLST